MSYKTLTEAATFDTAVVVPLGNQIRKAADLEAPVQALANRTKYLKAAVEAVPPAPDLSGVATKSGANTFTNTNTFSSTVNLNGQVNVNHDVTMKATLNLRSGGSTPPNIDVDGGIHADGAITSDSNLECHGVTSHGDITVDTGASIYANSGIVSGHTVNSDEDLTVTRDGTIGRNLTVGEAVSADAYTFTGAPLRYKIIPLSKGVVLTGHPTYVQPIAGGTGAYWVGDTASDWSEAFAIELPSGTILKEIAMYASNQVAGEHNTVYLASTSYPDWTADGEPTTVSTGISADSVASPGVSVLTKATGTVTINNSTNTYQIVCQMKASNHIRGIRIGIQDVALGNV